MPAMQTPMLALPAHMVNTMITEVKTKSTVAALSAKEPKIFGSSEKMIKFTTKPRAQFVEEGGGKQSSNPEFTTVESATHVAQVTMRTSKQFKWADEDQKLGIFNELTSLGAEALARALDLGLYHRINPITGLVIPGWLNYLGSTTHRVQIPDAPKYDRLIEAACGLLTATGIQPNGLALTPDVAWTLSTMRDEIGRKLYPELGIGLNLSSFLGLRVSTSTTVSGQPEAAEDTRVRAIVGDNTSGIHWGIAKDMPIETIEHGDPDNSGYDLKYKNEIALRLEIAYTWYVDTARFAVIEMPAEPTTEP